MSQRIVWLLTYIYKVLGKSIHLHPRQKYIDFAAFLIFLSFFNIHEFHKCESFLIILVCFY